MKFLSDEMISGLLPAETASFPSPVPTQIVSSDEYLPVPQTARQREVEARLIDMSDRLARRQGLSRRRFFQTAAGMAASFVALNQVFGPLFDASEAEAATPELAEARADALSGQMVIDGHTHFLRDDTRLMGFVKGREAVGQWGWNKELSGKEQTIDDLKYAQLREGNLHGQRHQGGAAVEFSVRSCRRTGSFRRSKCSRRGRWSTSRPARGACWRISPSRRASPAGWSKSTRRSSGTSRIRGRAIPSATTRTRNSPRIPGTPTTRS